jgi:hypothetical protein
MSEMMNGLRLTALTRAIALVLLAVSAGCGRGDGRDGGAEPAVAGVEVSEVRIGRSVGPDQRVTAETDQFGPRDSIFASVATQGSANNVRLGARWKYQDGQVVEESRETLSPTGPANTAFHVHHPQGWPAGRYEVEILVNDRPAETRQFTIRGP